jgi:uncharacterized protein YndB with AHSA1/START domain
MIKRLLLGIAGVVCTLLTIVLVLAAFKPDTFQVVRSIDIKAPPERLYPLVADFRQWVNWSPYENMGPMSRNYSGPAFGLGAAYAWEGEKPGAGRMEIVRADEPRRIVISLDFTKPFEAHNSVDFTFASKDDVTTVTWDMRGPLPYIFKIVHVVLDMDAMVGRDFETGLANLKMLAEK